MACISTGISRPDEREPFVILLKLTLTDNATHDSKSVFEVGKQDINALKAFRT